MMQDFLGKKILLGVCGGIAAYKSAYLVRELTQLGAIVRVVMTQSACQFITPMTMQALSGHEVRCDLFDSAAERAMGHIELARWADLILIAPATANFISKMVHGAADDLLSTVYLVSETPVIVCPAMNRSMWAHPATLENCKILTQRGVILVGPAEGSQACGEYGLGRMSEVENIIDALRLVDITQKLQGKRVLITSGPTREAIDPVRYLSNQSSGKMGYALANAARMAGAEVTLISGPTALLVPDGVNLVAIESAGEMFDAVFKHLQPGDIFIGCAAVADYRIKEPALEKIKKKQLTDLTLVLTPNEDILMRVATSGKASFVVGFAAETNELLRHAQEKFKAKKLDMLVANQVGNGVGFESDSNQVTVLLNESQTELPFMHKTRLAGELIAIMAQNLQTGAK